MSPNSVIQSMFIYKNCVVFSGDGTIDEEEFKSLCVSYGLSPEGSAEAYSKFTSVSSLTNKAQRVESFDMNLITVC
jgi:hypothetical protein